MVFFLLAISSVPACVYTMHDPYKETKKYGVSAVISSAITYGLWNEFKKNQREYYHKCGPVNARKSYRLASFTCFMGGASHTLAVIAAREGYNCYRFSKWLEEE